MSSCILSKAECHEVEELWTSALFQPDRLAELEDIRLKPVGQPRPHYKAVLEAIDIGDAPAKRRKPSWLSFFCAERDFFRRAVVRFERPGDTDLYFMLAFAYQSPQLVCFSRV